MTEPTRSHRYSTWPCRTALALVTFGTSFAAHAQGQDSLQACTALSDPAARLACFDQWAHQPPLAAPQTAPASDGLRPPAAQTPSDAAAPAAMESRDSRFAGLRLTSEQGCQNAQLSELSRMWELERSSDCGNFGIRGYRPIGLSVATADTVNKQPTSGNPLNSATQEQSYQTNEMRLQLSVRTKMAKGLLTGSDPTRSDSLWFAYSQQSYWQLFNPTLSRPFRSTDHEPEVIYIFPLQSAQADRWRLRYTGLAWVHQSNGQTLPLSRSWNRLYVMLGAEKGNVRLTGRVWKRTGESGGDDNPNIGDTYGRMELSADWSPNIDNQLAATWRHSLRSAGRGSMRLEWFNTLGRPGERKVGGLRLHTQLFSGYGDSLVDYNRQRTVFSVGLSLTDW